MRKFSCFCLSRVLAQLAAIGHRTGVPLDVWSPAFDLRIRKNIHCTCVLAAKPTAQDSSLYLRIDVHATAETVAATLARCKHAFAEITQVFIDNGVPDVAIGFRKAIGTAARREAWFTYTTSSQAWTLRSPPSDVSTYDMRDDTEAAIARAVRTHDLGTFVFDKPPHPSLCAAKHIQPGVRFWPCKNGLLLLELP